MTKRLLIDASHAEETRVVVLDGNRLEDFDVETATRKQIKGNIYLAKVIRVEPSLQAAFVEYGGNRHGFLAFGEIHPDYYQIPVADRQRLLKQQAEEEAAEARAAEAAGDEDETAEAQPLEIRPVEIQAAPPPEDGADEDAGLRGDDGVETSARLVFEDSGDVPAGDPPSGDLSAGGTDEGPAPECDEPDLAVSAPVEAAGTEDESRFREDDGAGADDGVPTQEDDAALIAQDEAAVEPVDGPDILDPEQPEAPAPESFGGDGDDAAEARERRQRQRFLRNYKIQEVIHRRQIMLIQVVKEERGNKGAALTTYLSLAGRFSVLMPNSPSGGGVSRKITSPADRRRLKEAMAELDVPEGMGLIVRTAGANRPKPEITRDCEYLLRLWDDIRERTLQSTAPALIYEEASLIKRTIRDVYTRDVDDVLVDGEEGWRAARDFMRMLMPAHARKVQLWTEGQPLFAKFQVEAQLDAMLNPIVQLRSGGYIVINQTEALVAIDVNSGRSTRERSIEDTALRTNLEAAEEVARQVRMRDLAGLIVIDFIDMESRKNNAAVERRMKDSLKNDRARIQVGSISHFGLMEMSRQRLRPSLAEASLVLCPHCGGMGHVRSPESAALHILRAIEDEGAKFRAAEIAVVLPPEIALYLFNHKRDRLSAIEARYAMRVIFTGDATLTGANFRIEKIKAQTPGALPLPPASYAGAGAAPVERIAALAGEAPAGEAPVMEDEPEETEETVPAEAASGGAPGETAEERDKRRRRRRRRRPGRRENGEASAPEAGSEGMGAQPDVVVSAEQDSEFDVVMAAELGEPDVVVGPEAADGEPTRRRRSRGGRRRRGPVEGGAESVTVYPDVASLFEAAEQAEAALRVRATPRVEGPDVAAEDDAEPEIPAALESVAALTVSTEDEADQAMAAAPEVSAMGEAEVAEEDPRSRGDDESLAAAELAASEPAVPKPVWAPKVIGEDAPAAEKKRGWWRK
jgi:ribonuclease E